MVLRPDFRIVDHGSFRRGDRDEKLFVRTRFRKALILKHICAAILAIVIAGPLAWWAIDRTPPYTMSDGRPVPNPAKAGDELDLLWHVEVVREGCTGKFQRILIDANNSVWTFMPMVSSFVSLPVGEHKTHSLFKFAIPHGVAPGPAKVYTVTTYECNPVHRFWPIVSKQPTLDLMISPDK